MPKIKDLPTTVTIAQGFPDTYTYKGGMSYYPGGPEQIHFSVPGNDNDELGDFHVTRSVNGSNVGIWYSKAGDFKNINSNNLPGSKKATFNTWWENNKDKCNRAAKEFSQKLLAG